MAFNAFLTPLKVEMFTFNRLSSNTVKILSAKFKSTIRDMFLVKLDLFRKNCLTNGICAHERKQGLQIAMGSDSLSLMVSSYWILCSLVRTLTLIKDWGYPQFITTFPLLRWVYDVTWMAATGRSLTKTNLSEGFTIYEKKKQHKTNRFSRPHDVRRHTTKSQIKRPAYKYQLQVFKSASHLTWL